MKRRGAFTLVELLVVIAIIAVLMAILMPALAKVRKQAKAVICQATLKQWTLIFSMYTEDNNGYFHGELGQNYMEQGWIPALRPYYSGRAGRGIVESDSEKEIRLCAAAKARFRSNGYIGGPEVAWGIYSGGTDDEGAWWASEGDCGSYGLNGWICNEEEGVDAPWNWRRPNVKGAGRIPFFADCGWVDGWPEHIDDPPDWNGEIGGYMNQAMKQFCVDRHGGGTVNAGFLDWSVRKVGLKELWTLKWHRKFETGSGWTLAGGVEPDDWPEWMRRFKDY
jgi:prepilin-type N-terminal cleavage/methylation domain-containing protein/prepilin-type processing-associated H-X9-DG protein